MDSMYISLGFLTMVFFFWAFGDGIVRAIDDTGHPGKIVLGLLYFGLLFAHPFFTLAVTFLVLAGWLVYKIYRVAWAQSKLGAIIFFLTIAALVVLASWH